MTLIEAIEARHSVRRYKDDPIPPEVLSILRDKVAEVNGLGGLHVQLVTEEPKAFSGVMAYGSFSGVRNYFIMAGRKADDLDEKTGYYGEQLVLLAQALGLNTCWAGLTYSKIPGTYELNDDEIKLIMEVNDPLKAKKLFNKYKSEVTSLVNEQIKEGKDVESWNEILNKVNSKVFESKTALTDIAEFIEIKNEIEG